MRVTNGTGISAANYCQIQNSNSTNQDSQLKSIRKQIENVQQQLQNLSNNEEMPMEEKMNKRKELQQQLQDLNKLMSQRKIEILREKREKSTAKAKSQEPAQGNTDRQEFSAMGTATMQGIISADASMKQVETVQSVKISMGGKAGVLESEIKMDKGRGGSTEKKEAELADLNDRINTASADMMVQISDINTALEKSREENDAKDEEKTDKTEAVNQELRLSGLEGEKLPTEIVKKAGNPETIPTESQGNSTQLWKSGTQAK